MFQYAVVEFLENKAKPDVDIVCMSWIVGDGTKTLWPLKDVVNKQKKAATPEADWKQFPIKIIDRAVDYAEARKMLSKAEFTSDVRSETDETSMRRKKRSKHRYAVVSNSDTDESADNMSPSLLEAPKLLFSQAKSKSPSAVSLNNSPKEASLNNNPRPREASLNNNPREASLNNGSSRDALRNYRPSEALWYHRPSVTSWNNGSVTQVEFSAFQEVLFHKIEELKEIELQNNVLLTRLVQSDTIMAVSAEDLPSDMPALPLSSMSEVPILERWLATNENKQHLVNHLSVIGGKDIAEITRNVMAAVFSKSVATEYNWVGQRGKVAFRELKLKDIVFGAVRKAKNGKDLFSFTVVAEAIKNWLKAARSRVKSSQNKF